MVDNTYANTGFFDSVSISGNSNSKSNPARSSERSDFTGLMYAFALSEVDGFLPCVFLFYTAKFQILSSLANTAIIDSKFRIKTM